MALFTAYFDASGKKDDPGKAHSVYVAGFVAPVKGWKGLERAWPALLDRYDIPAPLHMTDFMAHRGRYRAWMGEDETDETLVAARNAKRDAFRLEAVRLLKHHTHKPFGVGVLLPALRRMFAEYDVPAFEPREPFAWCAIRACNRLDDWWLSRKKSGRVRAGDRLEVVFEEGDAGMGELKAAAWGALGMVVTSRPNIGKSLTPFAACDFLAWEFRNWTRDRVTGYFLRDNVLPKTVAALKRRELTLHLAAKIKPSPLMLEVVRYLPAGALHYADWDALSRYCGHHGFPTRH